MRYQGKKEGIDFLLCPRDRKSKCMNFIATEKYKHAMDMYNDGGEKSYCSKCQTGAPKRQLDSKKSLQVAHAKNRDRANSQNGVWVGNQKIPYKIKRVA